MSQQWIWEGPKLPKDFACPLCGGPNFEEDDPEEGVHTCRDCGCEVDNDGKEI